MHAAPRQHQFVLGFQTVSQDGSDLSCRRALMDRRVATVEWRAEWAVEGFGRVRA